MEKNQTIFLAVAKANLDDTKRDIARHRALHGEPSEAWLKANMEAFVRHMHYVIRANIRSGNSQYILRDDHWWWANAKTEYRSRGKALAFGTAWVNKTADKQHTNWEDLEKTADYLKEIRNLNDTRANELEPAFNDVRNNRMTNWEMVLLEDYMGIDDRVLRFNHANRLHRLHISVQDPMQVAYYPSMRHFREGREVRTRLGRYLHTYGQAFGLGEQDIKLIVEKYNAKMAGRKNWQVKFIEHNDPDGWVNVYNSRGVSSCMRGMDAVRVYAHEKSELRLAYLQAGEEIIGRCIVRDDPSGDMTGWVRVYPPQDCNSEGRFLLDYLQANGYSRQTNLDGVLLQYIEEHDGIVCPYLDCGDNGDQNVDIVTRDGIQYLLAGGSDLDATSTSGYINQGIYCDECGEYHDEESVQYVEYSDRYVCDGCLDYEYVHARTTNGREYVRTDDAVYCETDSEWYLQDEAENHFDVHYCEESSAYYKIDDMVDTDSGLVYHNEATKLDHSYGEYDYAVSRDVVQLSDGTTCHRDDEAQLQSEIDGDEDDEAV